MYKLLNSEFLDFNAEKSEENHNFLANRRNERIWISLKCSVVWQTECTSLDCTFLSASISRFTARLASEERFLHKKWLFITHSYSHPIWNLINLFSDSEQNYCQVLSQFEECDFSLSAVALLSIALNDLRKYLLKTLIAINRNRVRI